MPLRQEHAYGLCRSEVSEGEEFGQLEHTDQQTSSAKGLIVNNLRFIDYVSVTTTQLFVVA